MLDDPYTDDEEEQPLEEFEPDGYECCDDEASDNASSNWQNSRNL